MGGWRRWALLRPDVVVPIRMVGVSASVDLPFHRKVQKFSSGTGSPGWSGKNGRKTVVSVCVLWPNGRPSQLLLSTCSSRLSKLPAHYFVLSPWNIVPQSV